ncbi:nucleotide disphospho-sugar-binding domain-containing protein [Cellulomonas endophytica]|uniref:nucleotide disphospho-sugar-binding domain-containing protein n=1 Tax=Cellulomonas endophytica TaxID=2494735 RepID=UPI001F0BC515|nr:nucleotide disphospho-sugar-binding domain-containing protein [Cellulomonas endophytica]
MMLLTAGTRGDVEPFLALARYAAARGHDVRLATTEDAERPPDVDVVGLDLDFRRVFRPPGRTPWALAHHLRTEVRPGMRRMFAAAVRQTLLFAPDVVVHHPLVLSAPMAADALGVPRVLVELSPVATPSGAFPAAGGPTATYDLGRWNRATYAVPRAAAHLFDADVARAAAGLPGGRRPPVRTRSRATLMAVSPQLLPRPRDWPAQVHLTGSWHDEDARGGSRHDRTAVAPVDPEVAAFVSGGGHLVASFGSMAVGGAEARARAVVAAARAHGLRALLLTGWGGMALPEDLRGDDVLAVRSAPFDAVLPGAAAVVHHGGAGTSHATARAGVPAVVVPVTADQPFWGAQLHRRGLAARPVPVRRLTAATLVSALGDLSGRRERAAEVGRAMRQEDGLGAALAVLTAL